MARQLHLRRGELSELRNVILDHKEDWTEWARVELNDLQKTIDRLKREFGEMMGWIEAAKKI